MKKEICKNCGQIINKVPDPRLEGLTTKPLQGVDGDYLVTNTGLIYSNKRHNFIKIINRRVGLLTNRILKSYKVDYLVAKTFFPNFENIIDPVVIHIDENEDNNHIDNLKVF